MNYEYHWTDIVSSFSTPSSFTRNPVLRQSSFTCLLSRANVNSDSQNVVLETTVEVIK